MTPPTPPGYVYLWPRTATLPVSSSAAPILPLVRGGVKFCLFGQGRVTNVSLYAAVH